MADHRPAATSAPKAGVPSGARTPPILIQPASAPQNTGHQTAENTGDATGGIKEVYFPLLDQHQPDLPPGKISLVVVAADEPAGKPIAKCQKQAVCLTVHRGNQDDALLEKQGAAAFRQARIADLCQEALSQGGLLTAEDLAYRIFFVSTRTITRDLAALKKAGHETPLPLRSTKHDIGPVLTHRVQIVRLALEGKTTSQICLITHHSPAAVANYLGTFSRVAQLQQEGMQAGQIAFLLRRGKGLVEQYLELLQQARTDNNHAYHLEELLRLGKFPQGFVAFVALTPLRPGLSWSRPVGAKNHFHKHKT